MKCQGPQGPQLSPSSTTPPPASSSSVSSSSTPLPQYTAPVRNPQQRTSNKEILIEFEVVAVNSKDGVGVINRWMSSSSGGSSSSTLPSVPARQQQERNPLNDKNLNDDGNGGGGVVDVGDVHPLPPPQQRGELNDNGIEDGILKGSSLFPTVLVNPFRKATKPFHVTLVPVSALISYPTGQRDEGLANDHSIDDATTVGGVEQKPHSTSTFYSAAKLVEKVMKIRKGIDKGDDGGDSTASNRATEDVESSNRKKSDGDDNYYQNNKLNDDGGGGSGVTAIPSKPATITTHIMLPVKYSPGDNNRDVSRTTSQPYETVDTSRKSVSKNMKHKVSYQCFL